VTEPTDPTPRALVRPRSAAERDDARRTAASEGHSGVAGDPTGDPTANLPRPPDVTDLRKLVSVPARVWYAREVHAVARDLLGSYITSRWPDGDVTVRITEVEAYAGSDDPGSHAFRGRTARNSVMFAEPGRLYVYRHLGLHHCVNVVAEPTGSPAAVLLRAGEVVDGSELAWRRRESVGVVDSHRQLARGPARLAVCLGLDLRSNGTDITEAGGEVVVHRHEGAVISTHSTGPRVGVSGAGGDAARHPWRYWLTDERTVSAYRPAYRASAGGDPAPVAGSGAVPVPGYRPPTSPDAP
jgi:DNA-3-methyladenine glycosylase